MSLVATGTGVPSTSDEVSCMVSDSDAETEFNDDYAVQGGDDPTPGVFHATLADELAPENDALVLPVVVEDGECEADAQEDLSGPRAAARARRSDGFTIC